MFGFWVSGLGYGAGTHNFKVRQPLAKNALEPSWLRQEDINVCVCVCIYIYLFIYLFIYVYKDRGITGLGFWFYSIWCMSDLQEQRVSSSVDTTTQG